MRICHTSTPGSIKSPHVPGKALPNHGVAQPINGDVATSVSAVFYYISLHPRELQSQQTQIPANTSLEMAAGATPWLCKKE